MPDEQAGQAGQCPGCHGRITLPKAAAASSVIASELLVAPPTAADAVYAAVPPENPGRSTPAASDALDRRLLDLPPVGSGAAPLSNKEVLAKLKFQPPPEYTGVRQLPWPIDILVYPANVAGLTALAIVVGIPVLLTVLQEVVFLPFLGLMFLLAKVALGVYGAWYWAECTADSAKGGTRAPQILDAAGYGDKWSRVCGLLAVYAVFVLPALAYFLSGGRNPAVVGLLLGWALVFFPMGLLAMVLHEGLYVLNPLFLLGSIVRTFVPYAGLLVLIAVVAASFRLVAGRLVQGSASLERAVLGLVLAGYVSLVLAHVLGRFYWRYRERLAWDV